MKYLGIYRTCPQNVPVLTILGHLQKCPESICSMSFFLFLKLVPCPFPNSPKMCPRPDMYPCVPDASRTCPQNFPVLTILGHLQIGWVHLRQKLCIIQFGTESLVRKIWYWISRSPSPTLPWLTAMWDMGYGGFSTRLDLAQLLHTSRKFLHSSHIIRNFTSSLCESILVESIAVWTRSPELSTV